MLYSQTHTNICLKNKTYDTSFNSKGTFLSLSLSVYIHNYT